MCRKKFFLTLSWSWSEGSASAYMLKLPVLKYSLQEKRSLKRSVCKIWYIYECIDLYSRTRGEDKAVATEVLQAC